MNPRNFSTPATYSDARNVVKEPVFIGKMGDFIVTVEPKDGAVKLKIKLGSRDVAVAVNRDLQVIVG